MDSKRNCLLDFLKGLSCIFIILCHVAFPGNFGAAVSKLFTGVSIGIFLMISGYYAYSENDSAIKKLKRRLFKIFKLFLISVVLYLVYRMFRMNEIGHFELWLNDFLKLRNIYNAIFFNDYSIIGTEHLWFLGALIYTYILMIVLEKLKLCKVAYNLLPLLLVLNVMSTAGTAGMIGSTFLASAVPFYLLGHFIAAHKKALKKCSDKKLILAVIMGEFLICLYYGIRCKFNFSQVGVIISSTALFLLAVNHPNKSLCPQIELLGRKYSLYVYVIHVMIHSRLNVWIEHAGVSGLIWVEWLKPIAVIVLSILGSIFIDYLLRKFVLSKNYHTPIN